MIKDILEHILEYISDEYEQYFFMSSCMDFWQMGTDWRQKHYTIEGTNLKVSPYMRRIMNCDLGSSIKIPHDDIKVFSLALANAWQLANDNKVVILASGDDIKEYIGLVKDTALYNANPELSRIVFTSYNIKSHYAYCKKIFTDKKPENVIFPNKIIITTSSYMSKILRDSYDTVYVVYNIMEKNRVHKYVVIPDGLDDVDYDIKTSLLVDSITPILNITHKIGFMNEDLNTAIQNHIDRYGTSYILSFNGYGHAFDGYENVIIRTEESDPTIEEMKETDLEKSKLYWRIKKFDKIVPINSIIVIVSGHSNKHLKIINKKCKYSRNLNITIIYEDIKKYVMDTLKNNLIPEMSFGHKGNDSLEESYKVFKLFGIDLFALNETEQSIICNYINPEHTDSVLEVWRQQRDNKLSEDGIRQYLSVYL